MRRLAAELLGTAGLLLAIVGSGITASSETSAAAGLLQHAVVVGAALAVLIVTFGPVSGAHFNPAVTLTDALLGGMPAATAAAYVVAQTVGAVAGVVGANLLAGLPAAGLATTQRVGAGLAASEVIATFGLVVVIFGVVRSGRVGAVAPAVGAWVAAAIYFTPSTSFANPAVTVARALTDTYTGIAPGGLLPFVAAQLAGALAATVAVRVLFGVGAATASDVVVPHSLRPDEEHR